MCFADPRWKGEEPLWKMKRYDGVRLNGLDVVFLRQKIFKKESGVYTWRKLKRAESNSPAGGGFCEPYLVWP